MIRVCSAVGIRHAVSVYHIDMGHIVNGIATTIAKVKLVLMNNAHMAVLMESTSVIVDNANIVKQCVPHVVMGIPVHHVNNGSGDQLVKMTAATVKQDIVISIMDVHNVLMDTIGNICFSCRAISVVFVPKPALDAQTQITVPLVNQDIGVHIARMTVTYVRKVIAIDKMDVLLVVILVITSQAVPTHVIVIDVQKSV